MEKQKVKNSNKDFTIQIIVDKSLDQAFDMIKDVRSWWVGLYGEEIKGKTEKIGDEFSFRAGGGAHYSKQKLVELIPSKKIVWQVIESTLTFLEDPTEWTGTNLVFIFQENGEKTQITFRHEGLVPEIESYEGCSSAWTNYLNKIQN